MNIYYKQSDITAPLSELMLSPWALECDGTRAAGIQEALHLIQDMINGEVPENMKIPAADVVEVVRCKDCKLWSICLSKQEKQVLIDTNTDGVCEYWMSDGLMPNDFCSYGKRKEGEA